MPRASHEIKSGNFRDVRQRVRKIFNPSERTFRSEVIVAEKSIFPCDAFWFFPTFGLVTSYFTNERETSSSFFYISSRLIKYSGYSSPRSAYLTPLIRNFTYDVRNTSLNGTTRSYTCECHLKKIPLTLHASKI